MIRKLIIEANRVNPDKFSRHFSKLIAKRSSRNYGILKSTDLDFQGEISTKGFDISPITNKGPIVYFRGKYIINESGFLQSIIVKSIIPFWWWLFYGVLSFIASISIIRHFNEIPKTLFLPILAGLSMVLFLYHYILLIYKRSHLKNELIRYCNVLSGK